MSITQNPRLSKQPAEKCAKTKAERKTESFGAIAIAVVADAAVAFAEDITKSIKILFPAINCPKLNKGIQGHGGGWKVEAGNWKKCLRWDWKPK